MNKRTCRLAIVLLLMGSGAAGAQYPILDMVADRVIQRYQSSTCEQLWQKKGKPAGPEEQNLIGMLRNDPQMRQHFFNKISGPIVNKMFECGMVP